MVHTKFLFFLLLPFPSFASSYLYGMDECERRWENEGRGISFVGAVFIIIIITKCIDFIIVDLNPPLYIPSSTDSVLGIGLNVM